MISPTSSRTSCSTTWEPMKPAPPITRTRRPRRSISLPPGERGDPVHDVGLLLRLELGVHPQPPRLDPGPLAFANLPLPLPPPPHPPLPHVRPPPPPLLP